MKKIITLFLFLLLLLSANIFADDDEKLKLAVMEFEDLSGKVSKATLAEASEYFRVIFAQTNRYIIISKDRQKEQISDMRKKYNTDPSYKSCTDKNCQIQLGQALSADLIVKTSVSYFAGGYTLASELIDLEKEATIIAATEEYDGTPQALRTAIKNIVNKIVEAEKKENNQPAPAATPVYQELQQTAPTRSKDLKDCNYARKEATIAAWKTYIRKHSDGECAEEAEDTIKRLEEEEKSKKEAIEKENLKKFYSKADECMDKVFTGRYNFGIAGVFNGINQFGISTGVDFNFNVSRKSYGAGAGNLFVGLGLDLEYYLPTADHDSTKAHVLDIPIMANFGYDFRVNNYNLRYIGLWISAGTGINTIFTKGGYKGGKKDSKLLFAWELGLNMIFRSRFMINFGLGGFAGKKYSGDSQTMFLHAVRLPNAQLFLNIGTIF